MSDHAALPVSTPGSASHSFGPIHPLVVANRIDAVEDVLNQVDLMVRADKQAAAVTLIESARLRLAELARVSRQEHDRREQLPPVRGDEAIMADLRREASVKLDDCFRDHKHTPTNHMPPMKPIRPRGNDALAVDREVASKAVRESRSRWNPGRYLSTDGAWSFAQWVAVGSVGAVGVYAAVDALLGAL